MPDRLWSEVTLCGPFYQQLPTHVRFCEMTDLAATVAPGARLLLVESSFVQAHVTQNDLSLHHLLIHQSPLWSGFSNSLCQITRRLWQWQLFGWLVMVVLLCWSAGVSFRSGTEILNLN